MCTLSVVKVAMQPLLHSSEMLINDVPSLSLEQICTVNGATRYGSTRSPDFDDVIDFLLGSDTLIKWSLRILDSVWVSD